MIGWLAERAERRRIAAIERALVAGYARQRVVREARAASARKGASTYLQRLAAETKTLFGDAPL